MDDDMIETEDPIHKVAGGYQWGNHGHVYPSRAGAEHQAEAAYANGYTGDEDHIHAAGLMLQAPSGKLLFLKRQTNASFGGTWCFPGGKCEAGEHCADAAIRECEEETGYRHSEEDHGELNEPLTVHDGFATHYADCEDEFEPHLNDEHTEHVWAHPSEAPQPLHPGVAHTLESIDWEDVPEEEVGAEIEDSAGDDDPLLEQDCQDALLAMMDSFEGEADPEIEAELLETEECAGSWRDVGVRAVLGHYDAKQDTEDATKAELAKIRQAANVLASIGGRQPRSKTGASRPAQPAKPKGVTRAPAKATPRKAPGPKKKAAPKKRPVARKAPVTAKPKAPPPVKPRTSRTAARSAPVAATRTTRPKTPPKPPAPPKPPKAATPRTTRAAPAMQAPEPRGPIAPRPVAAPKAPKVETPPPKSIPLSNEVRQNIKERAGTQAEIYRGAHTRPVDTPPPAPAKQRLRGAARLRADLLIAAQSQEDPANKAVLGRPPRVAVPASGPLHTKIENPWTSENAEQLMERIKLRQKSGQPISSSMQSVLELLEIEAAPPEPPPPPPPKQSIFQRARRRAGEAVAHVKETLGERAYQRKMARQQREHEEKVIQGRMRIPFLPWDTVTGDTATMDDGFFTPLPVGRTRRLTPEGFLVCEGVPIARTGIQIYTPNDFPNKHLEADKNGVIRVHRLPEDVFDPQTIASFEGKAVTVEHPSEFVNPENNARYSVGHVQNVRRGQGSESDLLVADLLITAADAIYYVNAQMPEVSCGYNADYARVGAGEYRQRSILGNHVALVRRGRAGGRVAVKDSSEELSHMPISRTFMAGLLASLGIGADKRAQVDHALATMDAQEGDDTPEASLEEQILGKLTALEHRLDAQDAAIIQMGRTFDAYTTDSDEDDEGDTEDADEEEGDTEDERKKREDEDEEAEAMGDTIIEAEGPGMTIQLGKVWTGDSASVDPYQAVKSLGEILAPGLTLPSKDELRGKQGKLMAGYMRRALTTAATRDSAGREAVGTFLMGRQIEDLKGTDLLGVFRGAGNLVRARNNHMLRVVAGGSQTTDRSQVTPRDFGRRVTPQEINRQNREAAEKERQETLARIQR